mgnify:CR=1 FL=1
MAGKERLKTLELKGHKYSIRCYKQTHLFSTPLDRFLYHLAYEAFDDMTNPPDWSWAALIMQPLEKGVHALRNFYPPLTWEEKHALLDVEAAIVFARPRRVEVLYFDDPLEAKNRWEEIKGLSKGAQNSEKANRS